MISSCMKKVSSDDEESEDESDNIAFVNGPQKVEYASSCESCDEESSSEDQLIIHSVLQKQQRIEDKIAVEELGNLISNLKDDDNKGFYENDGYRYNFDEDDEKCNEIDKDGNDVFMEVAPVQNDMIEEEKEFYTLKDYLKMKKVGDADLDRVHNRRLKKEYLPSTIIPRFKESKFKNESYNPIIHIHKINLDEFITANVQCPKRSCRWKAIVVDKSKKGLHYKCSKCDYKLKIEEKKQGPEELMPNKNSFSVEHALAKIMKSSTYENYKYDCKFLSIQMLLKKDYRDLRKTYKDVLFDLWTDTKKICENICVLYQAIRDRKENIKREKTILNGKVMKPISFSSDAHYHTRGWNSTDIINAAFCPWTNLPIEFQHERRPNATTKQETIDREKLLCATAAAGESVTSCKMFRRLMESGLLPVLAVSDGDSSVFKDVQKERTKVLMEHSALEIGTNDIMEKQECENHVCRGCNKRILHSSNKFYDKQNKKVPNAVACCYFSYRVLDSLQRCETAEEVEQEVHVKLMCHLAGECEKGGCNHPPEYERTSPIYNAESMELWRKIMKNRWRAAEIVFIMKRLTNNCLENLWHIMSNLYTKNLFAKDSTVIIIAALQALMEYCYGKETHLMLLQDLGVQPAPKFVKMIKQKTKEQIQQRVYKQSKKVKKRRKHIRRICREMCAKHKKKEKSLGVYYDNRVCNLVREMRDKKIGNHLTEIQKGTLLVCRTNEIKKEENQANVYLVKKINKNSIRVDLMKPTRKCKHPWFPHKKSIYRYTSVLHVLESRTIKIQDFDQLCYILTSKDYDKKKKTLKIKNINAWRAFEKKLYEFNNTSVQF